MVANIVVAVMGIAVAAVGIFAWWYETKGPEASDSAEPSDKSTKQKK